jgi:prevent-host-death family protein
VALARVKDDLSKYLRLASSEEIVITRHGRPAGVLIEDVDRVGLTSKKSRRRAR